MSKNIQSFSFTKKAEAGVLPISYVRDGRHIVFSIHADVNTTATIKVLGSSQEQMPDFAEASTSVNDWGYIAFRDLATANLIAGATGVTISNTTHHKVYEVESNTLSHVAFELTTVSGDGVIIKGVIKED
jgi:hypothetical protein